jgi:hypothetical protein
MSANSAASSAALLNVAVILAIAFGSAPSIFLCFSASVNAADEVEVAPDAICGVAVSSGVTLLPKDP